MDRAELIDGVLLWNDKKIKLDGKAEKIPIGLSYGADYYEGIGEGGDRSCDAAGGGAADAGRGGGISALS